MKPVHPATRSEASLAFANIYQQALRASVMVANHG